MGDIEQQQQQQQLECGGLHRRKTGGVMKSSTADDCANSNSSGSSRTATQEQCVGMYADLIHSHDDANDDDDVADKQLKPSKSSKVSSACDDAAMAPADDDDDDDEEVSCSSGLAPSIQRSLQQLCGAHSTAELLSMPARALDRADKMARQAWEAVDPLSTTELLALSGRALDKAEEMARQAWDVIHHKHLPTWLRDNDFIIRGHRPPLNSFIECFKSIFRIHSETGNIWTHLVGFIIFIIITIWYWSSTTVELQQKAVFTTFFIGAILCLGFSFLFHTLYCHSEKVGKIFCKLDYCGIALLVIGSFVPWLYYCFYCNVYTQTFYTVLIVVLGSICIIVSMSDKFGEPKYRPLRAGVFVSLGLSGVIPSGHYIYSEGLQHAIEYGGFGWLVLMAITYITGALIYALRIPERLWPGKFDIWFSSHQIFHVFVLAGAFIHYHGMSVVAQNQMMITKCDS